MSADGYEVTISLDDAISIVQLFVHLHLGRIEETITFHEDFQWDRLDSLHESVTKAIDNYRPKEAP